MKPIYYAFLLFVLCSCQPKTEQAVYKIASTQTPSSDFTSDTVKYEVTKSFLGEELPNKKLPEKVKKAYEKNLEEANQNLSKKPDNLNHIIWHGRRLAYLGRYQEAIAVYTNGLQRYPSSHQLRRHRGHRYITTRQINKAIDDFELAAFHSKKADNAIEPDGIPNKLNKPLSNDKFNIWYHFGLAYYLNGRFDRAVSAYEKCLEFSNNNDLKVATSYWLYLSARRIGNEEIAAKALENASPGMKLIENRPYLDLLLVFKGVKKVEKILEKAEGKDGILNPTLAYGIGNWYLQNNQLDKARAIFLRTLENPNWDAFGYIATEADIRNMATTSVD